MNGMHYDEYSSSTEISSQENLSDNEKINILIDHLKLLSKKYGLGEVKFWYEPFQTVIKCFQSRYLQTIVMTRG